MDMSIVFMLLASAVAAVYCGVQKRKMGDVIRDKVTGGFNYQYFKLHFNKMGGNERKESSFVSFDIDKFKAINLLYGMNVGDELLKMVSFSFREELPAEKLYRYHGDVFVAVINETDQEKIREKLARLRARIQNETEVRGLPEVNLTFGICPMDSSDDINVIYSNAALARQAAKESITEKEKFYDQVVKKHLSCRNMEMEFKKALKERMFHVWYQPKIDMSTGRICGAEALVRWCAKDGTMISPADFIPVFESTGQILELDTEVLKMVCRDIHRAHMRGISPGPVSVNLSKLHIMKGGIIREIRDLTSGFDIAPSELSFEITESATDTYGKRELEEFVDDLHRMGYQVDMDDYGTGTSTLRSLAYTHFDTLKLDRSFVGMIGDQRMDIILKSTIRMAAKLDMVIVAEGVENKEQVRFLTENGCFIAQGYYYFAPMPWEEYMENIKKGPCLRDRESREEERV